MTDDLLGVNGLPADFQTTNHPIDIGRNAVPDIIWLGTTAAHDE
jgi:hypothetical protein